MLRVVIINETDEYKCQPIRSAKSKKYVRIVEINALFVKKEKHVRK